MVTDQEPRYRLVDADGNVVGSLFAESDGTLKLQEGTSGNDNELSLTTQGALEVEQADVTNETLLRAGLGTDQNISAATFETVAFDTVGVDERGEFDPSSGRFVIDESGWYHVDFSVSFQVAADSDRLIAQFNDFTGANPKLAATGNAGGSNDHIISNSGLVQLDSGNEYEVRVQNVNNDDVVSGTGFETYIAVRSAFRSV